MKLSPKGIALLKRFEGVSLKAYQDSVGVWTIGYGHTSMAGGLKVKRGLTITQYQADQMLIDDLGLYEQAVMKAIKRSPTQNQFDAMTSLCFNIGPRNFSKSSIVRNFNSGDVAKAANSFLLWNKAGGKVLKGLSNRRAAERLLFLSASQAEKPAPQSQKTPGAGVVAGGGAIATGGAAIAAHAGIDWKVIALALGCAAFAGIISILIMKGRNNG